MNQNFPTDPMAAFYAAVTAVENGQVGEVEIEYRSMDREENETLMSIVVRKEVRHFIYDAL